MEVLSNLKTFSKILLSKGYNGLFFLKGEPIGSLEEILKHLGSGRSNKNRSVGIYEIKLKSSFNWSMEEDTRIDCTLWIKCIAGKYFMDKIKYEKKTGSSGLPIRKIVFDPITVITAPSVAQITALLRKEK